MKAVTRKSKTVDRRIDKGTTDSGKNADLDRHADSTSAHSAT